PVQEKTKAAINHEIIERRNFNIAFFFQFQFETGNLDQALAKKILRAGEHFAFDDQRKNELVLVHVFENWQMAFHICRRKTFAAFEALTKMSRQSGQVVGYNCLKQGV